MKAAEIKSTYRGT